MSGGRYPITPGGRYLVVRGRLWRRSDPSLPNERRVALVDELMRARRAVGIALRAGNAAALADARAAVDRAKVSLGERGPVWWPDGEPDLNRHLVANTAYASWSDGLERTRRTTGRDEEAAQPEGAGSMTGAGDCRR